MNFNGISIIFIITSFCVISGEEEFCLKNGECVSQGGNFKPKYLFYDVNFPEGFNLRRDVYMRLAIFMHQLQKKGLDWHLVLPPWHHLYHWKSFDIGEQNFLPWSLFFDVESMKRFSPVMEFRDFFHERKNVQIEKIYSLQHFKEAFSQSNWDWSDRWSFKDCDEEVLCPGNDCRGSVYNYEGGVYRGWFWGYKNITGHSLQCISFQGPSSLLEGILHSNSSVHLIMLDHAEVVLHDSFGNADYWKCRRSMRFSRALVKEANKFRLLLDSNDTADSTKRPKNWENEKLQRKAVGGPYICAHLRRGDFLYGRGNMLPSLEYAAEQLKNILSAVNLDTVFVATDSTFEEVQILQKNLKPAKLVQYKPDYKTKVKIKDGGVAIVDQIICSHSRFFIGTPESTYTFRIQEEREIIGFHPNSTFNLFCATPQKCFEASRWEIVY